MPRSRYIYLLYEKRSEGPDVLLATFTVKYEAFAFAAQRGLDRDRHMLLRMADGKASAAALIDWEDRT